MEEGKEEGGTENKLINICWINKSSEHLRMFRKSFNEWGKGHICTYCQENGSVYSLGLFFKESKEERGAHKSQGICIKLQMQIPSVKKIPPLENYSKDTLHMHAKLFITALVVQQKTGNNSYAHQMETVEYKLWCIYTRDYYAKLRKNEEVLSILTWKDLQTILLVENAGCRTMSLTCHPLCKDGRSGCSLCCKCAKKPGRIHKKKRRVVVNGGGWVLVDGRPERDGDFSKHNTAAIAQCCNKIPSTGWLLNYRSAFFMVLEAGKFKTHVWADSGSGETPPHKVFRFHRFTAGEEYASGWITAGVSPSSNLDDS